MKLKKNTEHTLIAEDAPWVFGILLIAFALIFSAIGIGLMASGEWMGILFALFGVIFAPLMFFLIVRRVQLVLYRPENWAEIRRKNLLRQSVSRYGLSEIRRAIVQSTQGENGTLYRVALIVARGGVEGDVPLTTAYSNVGKHHQVAEAINAWLGSSR